MAKYLDNQIATVVWMVNAMRWDGMGQVIGFMDR